MSTSIDCDADELKRPAAAARVARSMDGDSRARLRSLPADGARRKSRDCARGHASYAELRSWYSRELRSKVVLAVKQGRADARRAVVLHGLMTELLAGRKAS